MSEAAGSALAFAGYLSSAIAALVMATWLMTRRTPLAGLAGACGVAFVLTAAWALARPVVGPDAALAKVLLSASYLAWLWASSA